MNSNGGVDPERISPNMEGINNRNNRIFIFVLKYDSDLGILYNICLYQYFHTCWILIIIKAIIYSSHHSPINITSLSSGENMGL